MSDTIPAELDGLTDLNSLDLSDNLLSGTIPAELGDLTNLSSLSLGGNQLTGKYPLKWPPDQPLEPRGQPVDRGNTH